MTPEQNVGGICNLNRNILSCRLTNGASFIQIGGVQNNVLMDPRPFRFRAGLFLFCCGGGSSFVMFLLLTLYRPDKHISVQKCIKITTT
jgi:hypothetical protein